MATKEKVGAAAAGRAVRDEHTHERRPRGAAAPAQTVSVNRAPVLALWGAVVAERLGFDPDEALTLGQAVSVLNARSKGRRLGIFGPSAPTPGTTTQQPEVTGDTTVEILGRAVPVRKTPHGVRAMIKDEAVNPSRVRRYLEQKFRDALPDVRDAMTDVARGFKPPELRAAAYPLYERFRPAIPAGTKGWGARGELDLRLIRSLAPRRRRGSHRGEPKSEKR